MTEGRVNVGRDDVVVVDVEAVLLDLVLIVVLLVVNVDVGLVLCDADGSDSDGTLGSGSPIHPMPNGRIGMMYVWPALLVLVKVVVVVRVE